MTKSGLELIADERKRQIEVKGWTKEHDQQHVLGELSDLAVCYALRGYWRERIPTALINPFRFDVFKPEPRDRVRELVKAGALISAEIDRILNKESEVKND